MRILALLLAVVAFGLCLGPAYAQARCDQIGAMIPSEVTSVFAPYAVTHSCIINSQVRPTENRPTLSRDRRMATQELTAGDWLAGGKGSAPPWSSVQRIDQPALAHNLVVGIGAAVVDGVVVHDQLDR